MFEAGKLSYLNSQADTFFGTALSATQSPLLEGSQYLIMDSRCMYELMATGPSKVAEKLEETEQGSCSIEGTELG